MSAILTRLEAFEVRVPLPQPLQMGANILYDREYTIVRAHDDEGNFGAVYGLSRNAPLSAIVTRLVAPRWEKQKLGDHEQFYRTLVKASMFLGTNGLFWRGMSLADCAVYDLLAKRAGVPLCVYLGGEVKPTDTLLAGCYPVPSETPESLNELMHHMASYGAAGIKITSSANLARDTERMRICRAAIPDGPRFIIDLYGTVDNAASTLPEARKWEVFNMLWLEDPFEFDDYPNVKELADGLPYPVGVGDEHSGLRHFQRLIEQGHISVLRLDATAAGGVRGFIEAARMAAEHNVPVSTHVYHFLHTQLAAAVPNVKYVEYMLPESNAESIHLLMNTDLKWDKGRLIPNNVPGIGIDWNWEAVEFYRKGHIS